MPCCATSLIMRAPVRVEPVKETLRTSGWVTSAWPVTAPLPCTMLSTPAGKPACTASSAMRTVENGVSSEGLSTTALPAASAGPHFHDAIDSGKFHGVMAPTTPYGSAISMPRLLSRVGKRSPLYLSAHSA